MAKRVMFVHGAWLTPASWESFRLHYEALGHACSAPTWPFLDRPIAALRKDPHPALKDLTVEMLVEHYARHVRALPEPPILIGHSFGGLVVQLLLGRGLGAAGVAIDPVAPRGVLPGIRALRAAFPVFSAWNGWNRTLTMSYESFARSFAQTLSEPARRVAYERHVVPAPGRLFFEAALGIRVDFEQATRPPLLLIAGEADRTIELSMVAATYQRYQRSQAITAFKSFAGRSHFLIAEPGWEEIADFAIDWANLQTSEAPVAITSVRRSPLLS